jgi:hypothetical protein
MPTTSLSSDLGAVGRKLNQLAGVDMASNENGFHDLSNLNPFRGPKRGSRAHLWF